MLQSWISRSSEAGLTTKNLVLLLLFPACSSFVEVFGVAMFLPIAQLVKVGGEVETLADNSEVWTQAITFAERLGVSVSIGSLLLVSVFLFSFRQIFVYLRTMYVASVTARLSVNLRSLVFDNYTQTSIEYQDEMSTGSLQAILISEVRNLVRWIIVPLEAAGLIVLNMFYLILLLFISWEMTLFVLGLLLSAGYLVKGWIIQSKVIGEKSLGANMLIGEFLSQRLKGWRFPRLSGTEELEKSAFNSMLKKVAKLQIGGQRLAANTAAVIEPIVIFSSILFAFVGFQYLGMKVESLGLFVLVSLRLMPVGKIIIEKLQVFNRTRGAADIIDRRLRVMIQELEPRVINGISVKRIEKIELFNVSYQYPKTTRNALSEISCTINTGDYVAIVGRSGSGKSTFIDLLPRLRNPSTGHIRVNDTPLIEIDLVSLRSQISYLSQFTHMFSGTILDHLKYGNPAMRDDEISHYLELAGARNFIGKLPDGIHSKVGEDGIRLSGGQRQRIDLARALLGERSVLILDEPTNNLDVENIDLFMKTVDILRSETELTIVIITHDLEIAGFADQILLLEDGVLAASGAHHELMDRENWYSTTYSELVSLSNTSS